MVSVEILIGIQEKQPNAGWQFEVTEQKTYSE